MARSLTNLVQRGGDVDHTERRSLECDAVGEKKPPAVEPVMLRFVPSQHVLAHHHFVGWTVIGKDGTIVAGENSGYDVGRAVEALQCGGGACRIVESKRGNAVGTDDLGFRAKIVDQALAEREHVIGKERQYRKKEHGTTDEQVHARDSAGDRLRIVR